MRQLIVVLADFAVVVAVAVAEVLLHCICSICIWEERQSRRLKLVDAFLLL
jgi:hypothetical protein